MRSQLCERMSATLFAAFWTVFVIGAAKLIRADGKKLMNVKRRSQADNLRTGRVAFTSKKPSEFLRMQLEQLFEYQIAVVGLKGWQLTDLSWEAIKNAEKKVDEKRRQALSRL